MVIGFGRVLGPPGLADIRFVEEGSNHGPPTPHQRNDVERRKRSCSVAGPLGTSNCSVRVSEDVCVKTDFLPSNSGDPPGKRSVKLALPPFANRKSPMSARTTCLDAEA